jgi:hypothetical protein
MPPDQLCAYSFDNVIEIELTFLLRDLGLKNHLQEKIAELVGVLVGIAGINRVDHLVAFFKEVLLERSHGLLAIPWATARGAHPGHYFQEAVDGIVFHC